MANMLNVAIVGCGKVADAHAAQIGRIDGCQIVGVCDNEPLMAKQLFERFPVKAYFTDVEELLSRERPDVVHITTPPQSHFQIATTCLEHGCHVYVEKPFTVGHEEAVELIHFAQERGLKLTAGHNYQFTPAAQSMRRLVAEGYLGSGLVHMESYYSYNLQDPAYARALLGDKRHWVRTLPGKLLQNIISHGIARIAEFLPNDDISVVARGFPSRAMVAIQETAIIDELRVIIECMQGPTAYFTFSSQMKPSIHEFRLYGTTNGLVIDQDHEILIRLKGNRYKSYADRFIPPVETALQNLRAVGKNVGLFLRRDFHLDSGLKSLIEAFYTAIQRNEPVPIPYREILLTSSIMETIFMQLDGTGYHAPLGEKIGVEPLRKRDAANRWSDDGVASPKAANAVVGK